MPTFMDENNGVSQGYPLPPIGYGPLMLKARRHSLLSSFHSRRIIIAGGKYRAALKLPRCMMRAAGAGGVRSRRASQFMRYLPHARRYWRRPRFRPQDGANYLMPGRYG